MSDIPEQEPFVDDDDDRFDRLETETRRLNVAIEGLTKALVDNAQVQVKLAGLDERQNYVEDVMVPREELDARVLAVKAEQERYRRKSVRRMTALGVIIVVLVAGIAIAGGIVADAFSKDQSKLTSAQTGLSQDQDRFANLQYTMCMNNNRAVKSLRDYITAQRAATVLGNDPPAVKDIKISNFDILLKRYPQPTEKCTK